MFVVEKIFKADASKPVRLELPDLVQTERPGRTFVLFGFFATACDDEQSPAGRNELSDGRDRPITQFMRKGLDRVAFEDEIEGPNPRRRKCEEIGDVISDARAGEAFACPIDGVCGDVERDDLQPVPGEEFGVVSQAASDDARA